jgi:hypothetical protein
MAFPKLTPAQREALLREDALIDATYPGEYVAYLDTWNGDELTRRVLAHAPDGETFVRQTSALDPQVLARAEMTRTSEPAAVAG